MKINGNVYSSVLPIPVGSCSLLRTAVHECGHVLVALASGLVGDIVVELEDSISKQGFEAQEGGRVQYRMIEEILPTEATLLARIRISLAGMAAEELFRVAD